MIRSNPLVLGDNNPVSLTGVWKPFDILDPAAKMFAMLGFNQLLRLEDYVKDMRAINHDYILMGLDLRTDEEYAGVGG